MKRTIKLLGKKKKKHEFDKDTLSKFSKQKPLKLTANKLNGNKISFKAQKSVRTNKETQGPKGKPKARKSILALLPPSSMKSTS